MRFDYRGMGDSEGEFTGFEHIDDDIRAAVDAFSERCPQIDEVVLWGLCDAASAILFYAHTDPRISSLVLLNPWVHSEAGAARAYLKHYYLARLLDPGFWRKLAGGRFNIKDSLGSLFGFVRAARLGEPGGTAEGGNEDKSASQTAGNDALAARMAEGLRRFKGRVLLILSGRDLTAREFEDAAARSKLWKSLMAEDRISRCPLPPADHTFSRRQWRDQVERWTMDWLSGR
jgi:exosortase A-associated hydrolase 1